MGNATAKSRILKHSKNIVALVSKTQDENQLESVDLRTGVSDVTIGYKEAISYYKQLRTAFEHNVLNGHENKNAKIAFQTWFTKFTQEQETQQFSKSVTKAFNDIFDQKNKAGFNEDLINIMMVAATGKSDQKKQELLKTIKTNQDEKEKLALSLSKKTKTQLLQSAQAGQEFLAQEARRLMEEVRATNMSTENGATAFDITDMLQKIIQPAYTGLIKALKGHGRNKNVDITTHITQYITTARGFWFEAMAYEATHDALNKFFTVSHIGSANKPEDYIISSKNSQGVNFLKNLFKFNDKGTIIGMSTQTTSQNNSMDLINSSEAMKLQDLFGVQVKYAQLLGGLKTAKSRDFEMMKKFQRISNQNDHLTEFRSSVPLVTTAPDGSDIYVQDESQLSPKDYELRIAQAIRFMSMSHRIISTMGYLNVMYQDLSGIMWTSDLLQQLLNEKHYLSFNASLDKASPQKFGAAVGFRRFIFE